ncbi:TetR/AcrR family transcriptional regulator [Kordiimonas marina]|uniref:TetR/AcrR family transcriptional regulator n=1 Tax=Kordiimonas marina TaxID=2872312 RepID=UPI001FF6A162|nr:TetR/AcrR family transcriptional regulator [Kordiimonas marina]MCJ9429543.1 TetR/AcrR family transcriptional regulator [Kordiimonas marina]
MGVAKKRVRLSPEERRSQLLEAAVDLFARQGIGEAKHADVARAAGVSVATTFVYFPTREALIDAVLDDVAEANLSVFDEVDASGLTPSELLNALADYMTAMVDSRPASAKVWISWSALFAPALRAKFRGYQKIALDKLSDILATAHEPGYANARDDARILLAASQMLSVMKLDGEDKERVDRFTRHTIDVVLAYGGDK